MSADDALSELVALQDQGVILFENDPTPSNVWLEGWSPTPQAKETGTWPV
jgi:hypothetical protein